jgi:hypothetical protein
MQKQDDIDKGKFSTHLSVAANLAQVMQLILQVAGIILPLLTAGLLSMQPVPVRIPLINFSLGTWYQILLLICAFLWYLQFLRNYWVKHNGNSDLSQDYMVFLLKDLITKRPKLLTFFVLIFGTFIYIVPVWFWGVAFIVSFLSIPIYIILLNDSPAFYNYKLNRVWAADPTHKEKWFSRITTKLRSNDIVSTEDFVDSGYSPKLYYKEINFALNRYFIEYEFEQELTLTPVAIKNHADYGYYARQSLSGKKQL